MPVLLYVYLHEPVRRTNDGTLRRRDGDANPRGLALSHIPLNIFSDF